jgi:hypothetical protein
LNPETQLLAASIENEIAFTLRKFTAPSKKEVKASVFPQSFSGSPVRGNGKKITGGTIGRTKTTNSRSPPPLQFSPLC